MDEAHAERVESPPIYLCCTARSGSTWLQEMINHGRLQRDTRMEEHLASCSESDLVQCPASTKIHAHWIGARIHWRLPLGSLVVKLTRLDRRAQALSYLRSAATKVHNSNDPAEVAELRKRYREMEFDSRKVDEKMSQIETWESKLSNWIAGCHISPIHYEWMVRNPRREIGRVMRSLGVEWEYPGDHVGPLKLSPGNRHETT